MASVTFEGATRIYAKGAPPAVDTLDLTIDDGEFMVLVGPSGSGKTTALRMLAGLETVDVGHVRIAERDVTHVPSKDRDIAMVFQNYALYPQKTVAENMGFALKMQGWRRPTAPAGSGRSPPCSASRRSSTASPASSPGASASASRWAGRSCASRGSS